MSKNSSATKNKIPQGHYGCGGTQIYQNMKNKSCFLFLGLALRWLGKYKKLFLLLQNCFLGNQSKFISRFRLKSSLGRLNQQFLYFTLDQ